MPQSRASAGSRERDKHASSTHGASATRSSALPVVLDTSALVELLLNTRKAAAVRQAIGDSEMVVADLVNAEVLSTLRRLEHTGEITPGRATQAVSDLADAPLRQFPTRPLIASAWKLRDNVTAYDALHVSLAQALGCPFVTGDQRLAGAPDLGIAILAI